MAYDYPDWKPDVVKLESELIIKDDVETDANFSGAGHPPSTVTKQNPVSLEGSDEIFGLTFSKPAPSPSQGVTDVTVKIKEEKMEDAVPTTGSHYEPNSETQSAFSPKQNTAAHLEEMVFVSVNDFSSITNIKSEQDFVPRIKQENLEDEGMTEPATENMQRFLPEGDFQCVSNEGTVFLEKQTTVKLEYTSSEQSVLMKNRPELACTEANQEVGSSRHEETISTSYSNDKVFHSIEARFCNVNVPQNARNVTNQFDTSSGKSTHIFSERCAQPFKCKPDSTIQFPSSSLVIDDSAINYKLKIAEQNFTEPPSNDKTSSSEQCLVPSVSSSDFLLPDATLSVAKPFSCEQCPAKFTRKKGLKAHLLVHSDEKAFACSQCPARFKDKSNLSRHLSVHSNETAFPCDQCPARFKAKYLLQAHLITHSNQKAFSCVRCSARFKHKQGLQYHLLTHSNKRAFSCTQCSASFRQKCHLKNHLLTHSDEGSFSCNQCSAQFNQKANFKRHLLSHSDEREFSCDQCSARFKDKYSLKKHFVTHSNVKAFSCTQCSVHFKRKPDLQRHLKSQCNVKACDQRSN